MPKNATAERVLCATYEGFVRTEAGISPSGASAKEEEDEEDGNGDADEPEEDPSDLAGLG